MKAFLAWFSRNILLPLLPAVVGSAMRSMYSDHWSLESVDAAELSFCVALIGLFALTGVTRLSDKQLRDALSPVFIFLMAIALCVFAGSLLMVGYHQDEQLGLVKQLKTTQPISADILALIGAQDRCTRIQSTLRSWSMITCIFTVMLAILARWRYSIEDDDYSPLKTASSSSSDSVQGAEAASPKRHDGDQR